MRGDSIQDGYAKLLALTVLGSIAGVGALLDYWPVRDALPQAPSMFAALRQTAVGPPSVWVPSRVPGVRLPASAEAGVTVEASVARLPRLASGRYRPRVVFGTLMATPAETPPTETADWAVMAPRLEVADDLADIAPDFTSWSGRSAEALTSAPSPAAESDDQDGMLTEALKKTGGSIVRTGARAGSSIVGGIRSIGGVVRKAIPAL